MSLGSRLVWSGFFVLLLAVLGGCGIVKYPGQPGVVTNGYSKIDIEDLQAEGLYVYEIAYDNRPEGKGVGAIITKLYRKARTFTSNVRTNADGSVYRVKGQYNGAEVQMISIPEQNQIILPPNSTVMIFVEYDLSIDEVDDRNLAEESLFAASPKTPLSRLAWLARKFRWDWLRAGQLLPDGGLSYEVVAVELAQQKFVPTESLSVQTNLLQNGIRTSVSQETMQSFVEFLETHYPKGFKGSVGFYVKGAEHPMRIPLGLHSLKTAKASGVQIVQNADKALLAKTLRRFR